MKLLLVFLFTFCSLQIFAADKVADFGLNQPYVGARALGMGNAYTATVRDHNAIFYNPAALARNEQSDLRLFISPTLDLDILDFVDDGQEALDVPDAQKPVAVNNFLSKYSGEFFHARVIGPSAIWTSKNWGVAIIPVNFQINTQVNSEIGFTLKLDSQLDSVFAVSYADDLDWFGKNHWLSWGITGKAINRVSINEATNSTTLATKSDFFDLEKDSAEGLTVDFDLGFLWSPKMTSSSFLRYAEPSIALTVKNVIDYGFTTQLGLISENKDDEPEKLGRRFDVGTSWQLPHFWVFDPRLSIDMRDMGHDNWTFEKSYHAGLEFHWEMYSWWKGHWSLGVNQGYLSAGFGGKLSWFQLDIATWGEEVGTKDAKKEDRRYMAELSLNF